MSHISLFPQGFYSEKAKKIVPSRIPSGTIGFEDYLQGIKEGTWQDQVLAVRTGAIEKSSAQGVTACGVFKTRKIDDLISHSGFIAMDFDSAMNESINVDEVYCDPFIYAGHESISGNGGYVFYIKIDPEKHLDAFLGLEAYFANRYGLIADPSCKDVSRFRFVSFDPELYINTDSKDFKKYLPKKRRVIATYTHTNSNMDFMLEQVANTHTNILEDYYDWMRAGFALANEYGESGRAMYHIFSQYSEKYDRAKTDTKYNGMLRSAGGRNSIGTIYFLCANAGLQIKTRDNIQIEQIVKSRLMGNVKDVRKSVKDTLEMQGISSEEVDEIVESMEKIPQESLRPKTKQDVFEALKAFLSQFSFVKNVITSRVEFDGEVITDAIFSKLMVMCYDKVSATATTLMVRNIIDSQTIDYNPIKDWFNDTDNGVASKGHIDKLLSCIKYEAEIDGVFVNNYLQIFMKKWLLSVVASVFGTHSEMVLVFIGGQGEFKTKFFRGLLPEPLRAYYAESNLDHKTDSDILMCEKLMIMDDEFGGKSKQEAKHFKNILSKSDITMRKPYAREAETHQRIAVLCGTSNDPDTINDLTGNRRIIPVNVIEINKEKYAKIDKDKLWMELYYEWKESGDSWMLTKEEVEYLNVSTRKNEAVSTEVEALQSFFLLPDNAGYVKVFSATDVIDYIQTRTTLKMNPVKIGLALKFLGYVKIDTTINGVRKKGYRMIEVDPK
jgi:predicted P-loop ATPase